MSPVPYCHNPYHYQRRLSREVKVGKVDTDANRNTAMKFSINAIPTVISAVPRFGSRTRRAWVP